MSRRTSGSLRKERERQKRKRGRGTRKQSFLGNKRGRGRGRGARRRSDASRTPWITSTKNIVFYCFRYPEPPSYLGPITTSLCGYHYDHCETGLLAHSPTFEELPKPLDQSQNKWVDELQFYTEDRPSKDHFLIVFGGLEGKKIKGKNFRSKTDRFSTSPNAQTPVFLEAWWTDRWPTHEEAIIMKEKYGDFSMGKPPQLHCHGN